MFNPYTWHDILILESCIHNEIIEMLGENTVNVKFTAFDNNWYLGIGIKNEKTIPTIIDYFKNIYDLKLTETAYIDKRIRFNDLCRVFKSKQISVEDLGKLNKVLKTLELCDLASYITKDISRITGKNDIKVNVFRNVNGKYCVSFAVKSLVFDKEMYSFINLVDTRYGLDEELGRCAYKGRYKDGNRAYRFVAELKDEAELLRIVATCKLSVNEV